MQNRAKILGLNKKTVTIFHKIMLVAILHSTFIAPSQTLLSAYFNYNDQSLHYFGASMPKLNHENLVNQNDLEAKSNGKSNNFYTKQNFKNNQPSQKLKSVVDFSFPSDIKEGLIGVTKEMPLDDPTDNLFKFNVDELPQNYDKVILKYDLYGLQDDNGVSRSINNHNAIGGHIIKLQMGWTTQTEEIDVSWLKKGENKILFTTPKSAKYSYRIKNLKITVQKGNPNMVNSKLVISRKEFIFKKNDHIYVKGFVRGKQNNNLKVTIDDTPVELKQGEFEGLITLNENNLHKNFVIVKATDDSGLIGQEIISYDNLIEADAIYDIEKSIITATNNFKAYKGGKLKIDGASITIGDSCLTADKEISLMQLRYIDIAPMSSGIVNVTKGGKAYRFLPDGTKFGKSVKISIEYDSIMLPKGSNIKDVKTFFFDTQTKNWVAVKTDSVNSKTRTVTSLTDHFTDYINGIIQTPENPQTAGFTSTMMNDIKAADPAAEMTLISPPLVSQKGDANVSYPIKIPAGIKGMQPNLAVQYSNEGGNGWLGQGWNINIPSVNIDTRWGVPTFDPTNESEIYTIGGEQLMHPKVSGVDWMPNRHRDVALSNGTIGYDTTPVARVYATTANIKIFTPRKQGSFAKIERLGNATNNYYWKVTDTNGTINWYGGYKTGITENAIIRQAAGTTANIVHWGLYMTEDVFGNSVRYYYTNTTMTGSGNLTGGKIFNIKSISYGGRFNPKSAANDYKYAIVFNTNTTVKDDVSITARLGLKQIEPYFLDNIKVVHTIAQYGIFEKIRSYKFDYDYGVFHKGKLLSVAELDTEDKEFYKHTFDYYNDVLQAGANNFFDTGTVTTICNKKCYKVGFPGPRSQSFWNILSSGFNVYVNNILLAGGPFYNMDQMVLAMQQQHPTTTSGGRQSLYDQGRILTINSGSLYSTFEMVSLTGNSFLVENFTSCSTPVDKITTHTIPKKPTTNRNPTTDPDYIDYFGNLLNNFTIHHTTTITGDPNCPTFTNTSFPINTPSFTNAAALLGSTKSENFNIGALIGFGIDFSWNSFHKQITIDAKYAHDWDRSSSLTAMIDINGDSLEDVVYKSGNSLYWKKHIIDRTYNSAGIASVVHSFADAQPVGSVNNDIEDFYRSNGESSSWNFQVNFYGFAGYNQSHNWSRNNVYFTDANGDGLMDIVRYGTVYFNHLVNGNPYFEPESLRTENLLIAASPVIVDKPLITNTVTANTPNYDVVKVWEAPADGNIQIENTIVNTEPNKEVVATVELQHFGSNVFKIYQPTIQKLDLVSNANEKLVNFDPYTFEIYSQKEATRLNKLNELEKEIKKFIDNRIENYSLSTENLNKVSKHYNASEEINILTGVELEKAVLNAKIQDLRQQYFIENKNALISYTTLAPPGSNACTNGGFETNTFTNDYTFAKFLFTGSAVDCDFNTTVANGFANYTPTNTQFATIVDRGTGVPIVDPVLNAVSSAINIPLSKTGRYAIRLNDGVVPQNDGNQASKMTKSFFLDTTTSAVTFSFNFICQNPINHSPTEQPRLIARLYDKNGNKLDEFCLVSDAANTLMFNNATPGNNSPLLYTGWQCATLSTQGIQNLSNVVDREVNLEISVFDCSLSGHFGYVYIDDICTNVSNNCANPIYGQINLDFNNLQLTNCPKFPVLVTGTYTAPHSINPPIQYPTNTPTLLIEVLQNGIVVAGGTQNLPVTTLTNPDQQHTFQFSLNQSNFGSIPITGDFEFRVTSVFTINGINFTKTVTSARPGSDVTFNDCMNDLCEFATNPICLLYGKQLIGNETVVRTITNNCAGGSLKVRKGDRIYFRIHAKPDGTNTNPQVNWNPKVSYTDATMLGKVDQNGLKPYVSNYSDGFILSQNVPYPFPGSGETLISWEPITVASPTDTVTYEIVRQDQVGNSTTETVLYSKICTANAASTTISPSTGTLTAPASFVAATTGATPTPQAVKIVVTAPTGGATQFVFRVRSTSNLDWKAIEWKPKMVNRTIQNIMPNATTNEGPVTTDQTKYPIVDYSIYKSFSCGNPYSTVHYAIDQNDAYIGLGRLTPVLPGFVSTDNGILNFVVKSDNQFVGKRVITVANGVVTRVTDGTSVVPLGRAMNIGLDTDIEIGYYTDDSKRVVNSPTDISLLQRLANATTLARLILSTGSHGSTTILLDKTKVNLLQKPLSLYGSMHRQWGQFLYNPAKVTGATAVPSLGVNLLKEDQLKMTDAQATALYNNLYAGNGSTATNQNILNLNLIDVNAPGGAAQMQAALANIQSQNALATSYAFMTANPNRDSNNGSLYERWIGMHNENYASALGFRTATMSQSFTGFSQDPQTITSAAETGAVGIDKETEGRGESVSGGWGPFSGSRSFGGRSESLTDYMDLNGDRYPDIITRGQVQFTKKTGGLNGVWNRPFSSNLSQESNSSWGTSASGNFKVSGKSTSGASGAAKPRTGKLVVGSSSSYEYGSGGAAIGVSGSMGSGDSNSTLIWADVNGDGLPDMLTGSGQLSVQLNLGNNTFDSTSWGNLNIGSGSSNSIGGGLGFNYSNGSIEAGISLSRNDSDTNENLVDLNGDGQLDRLTHHDGNFSANFNEGNKMSNNQYDFGNFTLKNSATTTSMGLNGTYTYAFIWPLWIIFFVIPLKTPAVSVTVAGGKSTNRTKKTITDYDGDGFPDLVEEISDNSVRVYSSNIRRTDLLKTVTNPLGGSFTVDYKVQKVDYNNPHAKWSMSSVVVHDGYNNINDGEDVYRKEFVYENAKYDRREREFYGYETVKEIDKNADGTIYRTLVSKYHNQSYFLNGLLKESYITKGEDVVGAQRYSSTENTYQIKKLDATNNAFVTPQVNLPLTFDVGGTEGRKTAAVVLTQTINKLYQLNYSPQITTKVEMLYDQKGRDSLYTNFGDITTPTDDYTSKITYHNSPALTIANIINVPSRVTVSSNNTILRDRSTMINSNGTVLQYISRFNGTTAYTLFLYDSYGNIIQIASPANSTNQRMNYFYTYDSQHHKYIVGIRDSYGYNYSTFYDARFDKPIETIDISGNSMSYVYDSCGRNTRIIAPKEVEFGREYTIIFEYFPKASDIINSHYNNCIPEGSIMPLAVTNHIDPQHPDNDIQTISFIDGLGRLVQVKKDIELNVGSPEKPQLEEAMSVSGKIEYDMFGRVVKQYHPYYEKKSCDINMIINEFDTSTISPPAETVLDELDRPTKTIDSEGHTNTIEYSLNQDNRGRMAIKTKSIVDQNGSANIISEVFKNINGKVIATKNEGPNGAIWTNFTYNNINELLSYTDTDRFTTIYTYDQLGRKTSIFHPDNGQTTFKYDNANNLLSVQTANLATNRQMINYNYNYNHLLSIKYPNNLDGSANISNVIYEYGITGNETGRVITQQDATGKQNFKYGNMGETISNTRVVVGPNLPQRTFTTLFEYDSWNRLQKMTYPDEEKVNYNYNLGGSLTNIVNDEKYEYIKRIDYDYYEQRQYLRYGNNTQSFYNYSPTLRRMTGLNVKTQDRQDLFDNKYEFDYVGNVTVIANSSQPNGANYMGGSFRHNFSYDNLNRLSTAKGFFEGHDEQQRYGNDNQSDYQLQMEYNNMHSMRSKTQVHNKNGTQEESNTYSNLYEYGQNNHQLNLIHNQNTGNDEEFKYDQNGNMISKENRNRGLGNSQTRYFWDESNRLRVLFQNKKQMQNYFYDASGERILKAGSENIEVFENGQLVTPADITITGYTTYPSAFITVTQEGEYTKHYYAGTERIVSQIGDKKADIFSKNGKEDTLQDIEKAQKSDLQNYFAKAKIDVLFKLSPTTEVVENSGEATEIDYCDYIELTHEECCKTYPEFCIPNPCKKLGLNHEECCKKFPDYCNNDDKTPKIYYYHPDHLGTTTFLTDANGNPYQFFLNLPFGETMAEQKSWLHNYSTPYKFTGKELDEETGMYYFGSRYYSPRESIWLSVDPLAEKYPNMSPYNYCANNPILYIDPDGKEIIISGTVAQRNTILSSLRKLTNDKLVINRNGVVSISRIGGENTSKTLSSGSSLIRELNKKGTGEKSVTISITTPGSGNSENDVNSTNAINGIGSNTRVSFDPGSNPSILTKDPVTGNVSGESRPDEIGLGHELVHAIRSMKGQATDYSTTDSHTYNDATGAVTTQTRPLEELQTSGLKPSTVQYNENKLRIEQGLKERGAY